MILKSNIRELIVNSGYKRSFIADKLGITVKQLRNYETGHSLIPIDKAYLLVELLDNGVKVDDLYDKIDDNQ